MEKANAYLQEQGIDLSALLLAPDAVQISSGRPNRGKLIYALSEPLPSKSFAAGAFELRCGTSSGKSAQDVLPPSPHPSGTTYKWVGDWKQLPTLPEGLLSIWRGGEPPGLVGEAGGCSADITELKDLISRRNPSCGYDEWLRIGMAIHHETGGSHEGFTLWDGWSAKSSKYLGVEDLRPHWISFGRSETPVTLNSLLRLDMAAIEEFDTVRETDILTGKKAPEAAIILDYNEILSYVYPPREYVVEPIIKTSSLTMVFGEKGFGKSLITTGIGCAVATGTEFLKWKAPKQRKVLYIDAEMAFPDVKNERIPVVFKDKTVDMGFFRYWSFDIQKDPFPCLSKPVARKMIEDRLEDTELLILDNVSTLVLNGDENAAEEWGPIQQWLLTLRKRMAIILIHHAGRNGLQRGTTKREDTLDTIIALRHPKDYVKGSEGLRAEVHYDKSRGFWGAAAEPFEVKLTDFGWTYQNLSGVQERRALELHEEGLTVREIAKETGLSRLAISRLAINSKNKETEKI